MPGPKNKPESVAEEAPPGDDVNKSSEAQITKIKTKNSKTQFPRELQSPKFLAEKKLPAPMTNNEYELLDPMYSCNMFSSVNEKTDFSELFNSSTFKPDFSYSQLTLLCFIVN